MSTDQRDPVSLGYATRELRRPRVSGLAFSSLVIALVSVPVAAGLSKALYLVMPERKADVLGFASFYAMGLLGLVAGFIAIRRIRRSGGALRGRPIALVGVTICMFSVIWGCVIFIVDGDLRWR